MIHPTRQQRRMLEEENKKWPEHLIEVPSAQWPVSTIMLSQQPLSVWRSRKFLVQIFGEEAGIFRLSVIRTTHTGENWEENIAWDELQALKSQCGFADKDAVEVYPSSEDVVNVANMRHLWVLPLPLSFKWKKKPT